MKIFSQIYYSIYLIISQTKNCDRGRKKISTKTINVFHVFVSSFARISVKIFKRKISRAIGFDFRNNCEREKNAKKKKQKKAKCGKQ